MHSRIVASVLAAASLAGALAFATPARAEPTAAEKETARSLMDDGYGRRDRGDHAGALARFEGADAIMHVPTTSLEVAREQAALGKVVEARDTLIRVLRPPSGAEPEPFRVARAAARALDADLATKVAGLQITLRGFETTPTLAIDGAPMPAAALAAPFRVNPGHHVVVVTMAEGGVARGEVDVAPGETKSLALTFRASAPPPPATLPPAPAPRSAAPRVMEYAGLGLAGAGLAVGAIAGGISLSRASAAKSGCTDNRCPPATWSDLDAAHTTATISTLGFVAAGVGAAMAVTGFVLDRDPKPGATGATFTPWIGLGATGVRGTF